MRKDFEIDPSVGGRKLITQPGSLITVFPLLGSKERWFVQEFAIVTPSAGKTMFTYTAKADMFIYGVKVSFERFDDQLFAPIEFQVDDVTLSQPTRNDPTFPVGNGLDTLFPFHQRLHEEQTFKIIAGTWTFYYGRPTKQGIVHVRGALI